MKIVGVLSTGFLHGTNELSEIYALGSIIPIRCCLQVMSSSLIFYVSREHLIFHCKIGQTKNNLT